MTLPVLLIETGDVKAGFFCYYVKIKKSQTKVVEEGVKNGKDPSVQHRGTGIGDPSVL